MRILAADLSRLCYNAIQFSAKDSVLGGAVTLRDQGDHVAVYASDDYVALIDRAKWYPVGAPDDIPLGLKDVKELERALRGIEGELELEVSGGLLLGPWEAEIPILTDPPDFGPVIEVVESVPHPWPAVAPVPFAIRAERFAKFRLLRTPESPSTTSGYPVDFLWDGELLRFKVGPYLRGVVGPLARESFTVGAEEVTGITDLYAEEPQVLWQRSPEGVMT